MRRWTHIIAIASLAIVLALAINLLASTSTPAVGISHKAITNFTNFSTWNPVMPPDIPKLATWNPVMPPDIPKLATWNPVMPPDIPKLATWNPVMPPDIPKLATWNPVMPPGITK